MKTIATPRRLTTLLFAGLFAGGLTLDGPEVSGKGKPNGGPSYQVVQLDHVGSDFDYFPTEINDSGLIVGTVDDPILNQSTAACWTVTKGGGQVTSTLHFLNGGVSADGLNSHGEIVGSRFTGSSTVAVYWADRDATPLDLPPLNGDDASFAFAINNQGVICGSSLLNIYGPDPEDPEGPPIVVDQELQAVVWKVAEGQVVGPVKLPAFGADNRTAASDLSDNDANGVALVVGGGGEKVAPPETQDYPARALVWSVTSEGDGSLTVQAPSVLHNTNGVGSTEALGINNQAQICGYIRSDGVVWDGTVTQVLDRSATFRVGRKRTSIDSVDPVAINAVGEIVGTALGGLSRRAALWPSPNEEIVLLDSFLKRSSFEHLNGASDINGDGEIVGYGTDTDLGFSAGFLAIPQ